MTDTIEKGTVGSSLENFLVKQGTLETTTEQATKRVLAFQLTEKMKAQRVTKAKIAAHHS